MAEKKGATAKKPLDIIGFGRLRRAAVDGDVDERTIYCVQVAGMIGELRSAKEVIL